MPDAFFDLLKLFCNPAVLSQGSLLCILLIFKYIGTQRMEREHSVEAISMFSIVSIKCRESPMYSDKVELENTHKKLVINYLINALNLSLSWGMSAIT